MDGFEDKLNDILSSPESMNQILALVKSLEGGGTAETGGENKPHQPLQIPSLDPKMMKLLTQVMSEYGKDDGTVAALYAIKPFLKEDKQERIDKAMEMAKLARLAKLAIGGLGNV